MKTKQREINNVNLNKATFCDTGFMNLKPSYIIQAFLSHTATSLSQQQTHSKSDHFRVACLKTFAFYYMTAACI